MENVLTCTPSTSRKEIKSFIERALRDSDSQYVILAFQNLNRIEQQFIVDQIKNYKEELEGQKLRLKLCLVGNS